ncbi:regulatory protein GemA [Stappia sp.]|uniref:regulatory protein GemA n=1 Tax=Stappia sp. TaxID=1870903 RepID=UPI003D10FFF4
MSGSHAIIHVGLKQLGIGGDDARDLYERVTGARSLRAMSPPQHQAVVGELERLGFKRGLKTGPAKRATGPFAGKLQALWIAAYNLGVVRNGTDEAMMAFVTRQTGLSHARFLRVAEDAEKAIEAIKGWVRRATGNDGLYRRDRNQPPLLNDFRFQILLTQWARLTSLGAAPATTLDAWLGRTVPGKGYGDLTKDDWIDLMNVLGRCLRAAINKPKAEA